MKKSKIVVLLLSLALLIGGGKNNLKLGQNVGETNKNNNIVQKLANYSSEVYYTLSFTKNSSNTAYAKNYDVTVNEKTWSVPGNQSLGNYVKVGGKSISKAVRRIYSKDALSANIGKIVIEHGSKNSQLTCNKLEIKVYASMDDCINENNPVLTKIGGYEAEKESVIELDQISGYDSLYYSIDYTLSNSNKDNYGLIIKSIRFYEFENDISEIAKNDIKATTTKAQIKYSFDVNQKEGVSSFVKVTTAPSDWSGQYLIGYEVEKENVIRVLNAGLTEEKIKLASNYFDVTNNFNNVIDYSSELYNMTVTLTSTGNAYAIKSTANGYYLKGGTSPSGVNTSNTESAHTLTFNSTTKKITIKDNAGDYLLQYNTSSPRFRYYGSKSNQQNVYLYKYTEQASYSFFNMKMNLGAVIKAAKVQALVDAKLSISSYGVAVAQKSKLGESTTISDAVINNGSYVGIVSIVSKQFEGVDAMQKTDVNGTAKTGDYVIFNADLSFPDKSKYNVEVSAVAFFKLGDGTYVFFQERTLSVASLAQLYIENTDVYNKYDSDVQGSLKALAATPSSVA